MVIRTDFSLMHLSSTGFRQIMTVSEQPAAPLAPGHVLTGLRTRLKMLVQSSESLVVKCPCIVCHTDIDNQQLTYSASPCLQTLTGSVPTGLFIEFFHRCWQFATLSLVYGMCFMALCFAC